MASETFNLSVSATGDPDVYLARTWTTIWARLESTAGGTNKFGYNNQFAIIEPGDVITHILAPGTQVKIKTDSTTNVQWAIMVTELTVIDDLLSALCAVIGAR